MAFLRDEDSENDSPDSDFAYKLIRNTQDSCRTTGVNNIKTEKQKRDIEAFYVWSIISKIFKGSRPIGLPDKQGNYVKHSSDARLKRNFASRIVRGLEKIN